MYNSVDEIRSRYEPNEIVDLEKRVDCYTWCYPIELGEFDDSTIWDKNFDIKYLPQNLTLYFHIPFCKFICNMCPFTHEVARQDEISEYAEALLKEIDIYSKHSILKKTQVTSIYFGGGTASLLPSKYISLILYKVYREFNVSQNCQITVECHPKTVDKSYLSEIKEAGVNRVSFGLQSFNQQMLDSLSLHQDADSNIAVVNLAHKIGFDTIAADLMYNFPQEKIHDLEADIKMATSLGIHNLSLYAIDPAVRDLTIKQNAIEYEKDMFYKIYSILTTKGYIQVAQPDYSLPSHENKQILDLWGAPQALNLGFGAGAFSENFNGFTWANIHDPKEYIRCLNNNQIPILMGKKWSKDEEISRFAALGVRCLRLDLNKFNELFDVDFNGIFKYEIELLKYYGYIEIDNGYLTVSKKGKFYIDNISKMFFSFNNRGKTQLWGCKLRKVKPSKYTTINEVKRRLYYGK